MSFDPVEAQKRFDAFDPEFDEITRQRMKASWQQSAGSHRHHLRAERSTQWRDSNAAFQRYVDAERNGEVIIDAAIPTASGDTRHVKYCLPKSIARLVLDAPHIIEFLPDPDRPDNAETAFADYVLSVLTPTENQKKRSQEVAEELLGSDARILADYLYDDEWRCTESESYLRKFAGALFRCRFDLRKHRSKHLQISRTTSVFRQRLNAEASRFERGRGWRADSDRHNDFALALRVLAELVPKRGRGQSASRDPNLRYIKMIAELGGADIAKAIMTPGTKGGFYSEGGGNCFGAPSPARAALLRRVERRGDQLRALGITVEGVKAALHNLDRRRSAVDEV
ncbi:hypothetical protein [Henriciella aquimarina]|uniref:hypothetical protein n=1 Tax=Henriciella aquimarina TaxID=545261 RepID=UPI000A05CCA0|nr:hypothetical protein [Henriciella aquimarina]